MTYPNYNSSNSWNNNPKPKKSYGRKSSASSSGDFQAFLDYLDQSGQGQAFRQKILNTPRSEPS